MAIRQELVDSAVTFLSDPSVASSPLDKRIAFLQSKNLTQEEIDASLAQAGGVVPSAPASASYGYQQQQMSRPQQPPQYGYGQYPQGYWQPPPPEVPRRDWRDYFIMATVMSGLGYGVYTLAKRYVVPLVAPPTTPQLEQDKASIDTSFTRAFNLIDQLTADTTALKDAEASRTEKLDSALAEMETVVADLKTSTRRRDDDSRRINDEVRSLQGMIPKAMKAQEDATDARLKELNAELKSLKTLISNRMSGQGVPQAAVPRANQGTATFGSSQAPYSTTSSSANVAAAPPAVEQSANGPAPPGSTSGAQDGAAQQQPDRSNTGSPFNRFGGGSRGGIPAWQMAASKKSEEKAAAAAAAVTPEVNEADANGNANEAAAAASSIVS